MARKKNRSKKADSTMIAVVAAAGLAVVTGIAAVLLGRRRAETADDETHEHVPTDLTGVGPDLGPALSPAHRAPAAFRPDMDAPMSAAEREAMRPATIGAPPRDPGEIERV